MCVLFKTEIQYLGHLVSVAGVDPMPEKIQVLKDLPTPHCLKDVRAFLGLASYYGKFVKGFATIAEPLTALTKVRFTWTPQAQEAFETLKQALMDATSLAFPVPYLPCIFRHRCLGSCHRSRPQPESRRRRTPDCILPASHESGTETVLYNKARTSRSHLSPSTLPTLPDR